MLVALTHLTLIGGGNRPCCPRPVVEQRQAGAATGPHRVVLADTTDAVAPGGVAIAQTHLPRDVQLIQ